MVLDREQSSHHDWSYLEAITVNKSLGSFLDYYGFSLKDVSDDYFRKFSEMPFRNFDFLRPKEIRRIFSSLPNEKVGQLFVILSEIYLESLKEWAAGKNLDIQLDQRGLRDNSEPKTAKDVWLRKTRVERREKFDNLLELMQQNPNVPVELISHLV